MCGICHDVSNPAYSRNTDGTYSANAFGEASPSFNTYDMFPVERTYSEWLMSQYNTPEGVFAPGLGGNRQFVSTCQDCHMRDLSGVAANKASAVFRNDLPHHDMTGGNTFVPALIKAKYSNIVNPAALDSGIVRARYMLRHAASMDISFEITGENPVVTVRITNETGHKLPSGYPEGRRIWINLIARDNTGAIVYESGHYDNSAGILEKDNDIKIYEVKPGMDEVVASLTGFESGPGFHFVLNNKIFSDNRIPPRGFTNANFAAIQSPPVYYSYADGQYWDDTEYYLPAAAVSAEVILYYQTISKEYIDFLKEENTTNNTGQILYDLWAANGKSAPEMMVSGNIDFFPTDMTDQPVSDGLSVYPNPAGEWISLRFAPGLAGSDLFLSVADLSGKYLIRSQMLNIEGDIARIYTGNLKAGHYLFILEEKSGNRLFFGRFVIK